LFKRPMVIAYRVNWLTYRIMWPKRLQPWIGLPNILCGDFVVPELLQQDATPENMAAALLEWLAAPAKIAAVQTRFTALHHELRRDTEALATDAIEKVLAG
ncbi:MAG: lipid-A-disaccharide synthase, partial [Ramlibacter sp.]